MARRAHGVGATASASESAAVIDSLAPRRCRLLLMVWPMASRSWPNLEAALPLASAYCGTLVYRQWPPADGLFRPNRPCRGSSAAVARLACEGPALSSSANDAEFTAAARALIRSR